MSVAVEKTQRPGWREVLRGLSQPKVGIMLMLGFSSGLPFMLVGNTMGFWLREGGIELSAIGFLSWVGIAYSLKFLWAPVIDKVDVPLLGRWLGHRRGWMVLMQLIIAVGLIGMAMLTPQGGLGAFAAFALVAAFASATQDIVIDAWRIESSEAKGELALLTSAYQLGYRTVLLITEAVILILAAKVGWTLSYVAMAALMCVGLAATLFAREPLASLRGAGVHGATLWSARGLFDAVAGPFIAFFKQHGKWALLMLVAISVYRMPDFVMGPMANPFYADLHIAKETVGEVRGSFGWFATFGGIAVAGLFAMRFGVIATLLVGGIIGPSSILAFAYMAHHGGDPHVFAATMVIDNFSQGFAGVALIGYMSSLTNIGYTATQYALLSSFYALPGKLLKGFSGVMVENLAASHGLMDAYALFFIGVAMLGIPAFLLCVVLALRKPEQINPVAIEAA
ncbi:MAG: MFS transporter [Lysobacteraceae bacterium]